eukprot:CAMPEP_0183741984 /NCGR_PEP_ID=MMETSP0737-20130205/63661_1 /TAXON_ID=385413 /ORGANISM="Thalassiosira miniscula, Strain CCMP1093" /LENGTH=52 /DNA_ID=CAMNT_0025977491 /DNA_START=9 /DNA_END=163 /DNA_ORIENTATION=+
MSLLTSPFQSAPSPSPSRPGVYVDKQTSLLLAPPSWAPGSSSRDKGKDHHGP